jgi:hypothetical protein
MRLAGRTVAPTASQGLRSGTPDSESRAMEPVPVLGHDLAGLLQLPYNQRAQKDARFAVRVHRLETQSEHYLSRRYRLQGSTSTRARRKQSTIFTIGYQRHSIESLVRSLSENGVEVLMDVRQNPSSRKPGFSKIRLGDAIGKAGITYLHRPDLGTPPVIRTIYRQSRSISEALAEYERHISANIDAIQALADVAKTRTVCLLCLETDHDMCHRGVIARKLCEMTKWKAIHLM